MSNDVGRNPLRYDCAQRGCFNKIQHPKTEVFAECFPGRISFGDIDGIVERNGMAVMLEWKCWDTPLELDKGQRIMFSKLSKTGLITVLCLMGNAQTMVVTHKKRFFKGKESEWSDCTLDGAKEFLSKWSKWTDDISNWRTAYEAAGK